MSLVQVSIDNIHMMSCIKENNDKNGYLMADKILFTSEIFIIDNIISQVQHLIK